MNPQEEFKTSHNFDQPGRNSVIRRGEGEGNGLGEPKKPAPNFVKHFRLKPRTIKIAAIMLFLCVGGGAGGWWLWNNHTLPSLFQEKEGPLAPLVVDAKYGEDNFSLQPQEVDGLGMKPTSAMVLTSKTALDPALVQAHFALEPKVEVSFQAKSSNEFVITPKAALDAGAVYKMAIETEYKKDDGSTQHRDYNWAYQVKNSFQVLGSLPRTEADSVPVSTGIEFAMSYEYLSLDSFRDHFSISPAVEGDVKIQGRYAAFVPRKKLEKGTVYTATLKKGFKPNNSDEELKEDYKIEFRTEFPDQAVDNSKSVDFQNPVYDMIPGEVQDIIVNTPPDYKGTPQVGSTNTQVEVSVYTLPSFDEFLKVYQADSWEAPKLIEKYPGKKQIFKVALLPSPSGYSSERRFQLPATIAEGFYFMVIGQGKNQHVALLQSSSLSAYFANGAHSQVVWATDLKTKQPLPDAVVGVNATSLAIHTDSQGLATFDAGSNVVKSDAFDASPYFVTVRKDTRAIMLVPPSIGGDSDSWADYWNYLYTSRDTYQPTDTVKIWGLFRPRDAATQSIAGKTVELKLMGNGGMTLFDTRYGDSIPMETKTVPLSSSSTFEGSFDIHKLTPGSYEIVLAYGGKDIRSTYIAVEPYVKPAYKIDVSSSPRAVYVGEKAHIHTVASFFEGTPVAHLELSYDAGEEGGKGTVTTNAQGVADFDISLKPTSCDTCYPRTVTVSVRPTRNEEGSIEGDADVYLFNSSLSLDATQKYKDDGTTQAVDTRVNSYNLNAFKDPAVILYGSDEYAHTPVKGQQVSATLYETHYDEVVTGQRYDVVEKKNVPITEYQAKEEVYKTFTGTTGDDGNASFDLTQTPFKKDRDYRIEIYAVDGKGKKATTSLYLYSGHDASDQIKLVSPHDGEPLHLNTPRTFHFQKGTQDVVAGANDHFLYFYNQRGKITESRVGGVTIDASIGQDSLPERELFGVWFDGRRFLPANPVTLAVDEDERTMNIAVKADKPQYKPGENVTLLLQATKKTDGSPLVGELQLNVVDEAYYAIHAGTADPYSQIYETGDWYISTAVTHDSIPEVADGGKGGCFLAGTMIRMADGSTKPIESITQGDHISTFESPQGARLVEDTVVALQKHTVGSYLLVNGFLKVTSVHRVYSNDHWKQIGDVKVGDWLLGEKGKRVVVASIEEKKEVVQVYNFTTKNHHTYFADGIYVHNDKGGGVREVFPDDALFRSVHTDDKGMAQIVFTLPDTVTSWHVTAQGVSDSDMYVGLNEAASLPVSLPFFTSAVLSDRYHVGDTPVMTLRAQGTDVQTGEVVAYHITDPLGGVDTTIQGTVGVDAEYKLAALSEGSHTLTLEASSHGMKDAIRRTFLVDQGEATLAVQSTHDVQPGPLRVDGTTGNLRVTFVDRKNMYALGELYSLACSCGSGRSDIRVASSLSAALLKDHGYPLYQDSGDLAVYQRSDGGLSLFPYGDSDAALSAMMAYDNKDNVDASALRGYFNNLLYKENVTPGQAATALFGLASLGEPVVQAQVNMLNNPSLNQVERMYLGLGLDRLGATEYSRVMYYDIANHYKKQEGDTSHIQLGADELMNAQATVLFALLGSVIQRPDAQLDNGINHYSYEILQQITLERFAYAASLYRQRQYEWPSLTVVVAGEEKNFSFEHDSSYTLVIPQDKKDQVSIKSVSGDVAMVFDTRSPLTAGVNTQGYSISRTYKSSSNTKGALKADDVVTVTLDLKVPQGEKGWVNVSDTLPAGLRPLETNPGTYFDLNDPDAFFPYSVEGRTIRYRVDPAKKKSVSYTARVVNKGSFAQESAAIQSLSEPWKSAFSAEGSQVTIQ